MSPDIPHKTDVGGVRLGLENAHSVRDAYHSMLKNVAAARPDAALEGVLIEPMYRERHGREVMIGVVRDPVLGPAISFGLGGTLVEVIRDRAVALPPLNRFLVHDLIRRTRAGQALQPLRGAPAADEAAVEEILLRVSEIVCELPDVGALDRNPVIVTGTGAIVVDARLGVRRSGSSARPYDHKAIHPYPVHLESSWQLPDGTAIVIRPIRPEDAEIEDTFMRNLTRDPDSAADHPVVVRIGFEAGNPVEINNVPMEPVELLETLNGIAGEHGVGRADVVEDRLVGMKSRGVYETPGGTVLYAAHRELEQLVLDRRTLRLKDELALRYADLLYDGRWWTREREALDALVSATQERVTGWVQLKLYKGGVSVAGRSSPYALYQPSYATYGKDNVYDQKHAEGFIHLYGLPIRIGAGLAAERMREIGAAAD